MALEPNKHSRLIQRFYLGSLCEINGNNDLLVTPKTLANFAKLGKTAYVSGQDWKIVISSEAEQTS